MGPSLLQDDILKAVNSVGAARTGNIQVNMVYVHEGD
jgi:hypothetical protein